MRMMFSSARLENVEQVKALFDAAGIECRIIGGRSYKTYSRRGFSYNEKQTALDEPQPQLWVSRADDYRAVAPRLYADAGLLGALDDLGESGGEVHCVAQLIPAS